MAEENNQEEGKKSPIKLILMIVGGIVLLGVGIGIGILMSGGEDTDPSSEISQIIEKKENPEKENEESANGFHRRFAEQKPESVGRDVGSHF